MRYIVFQPTHTQTTHRKHTHTDNTHIQTTQMACKVLLIYLLGKALGKTLDSCPMVFLPLRPLGPSRLSQGCDCWSNRILVQDEAGLFFSPWTLCQLLLYPVCLCLVGMFRYLRTMSHFGGEGLPLHDSWKWQRMRGRVVVYSTFENVDSPWPFFSCANKEGEGWLMPVHLQGTSGRNQKSFRKHPMYKSIRLCHTQNYGHFYFGIALCWTYWTHRKLSTYSSRATVSSFQILSWDCALSQSLCVFATPFNLITFAPVLYRGRSLWGKWAAVSLGYELVGQT